MVSEESEEKIYNSGVRWCDSEMVRWCGPLIKSIRKLS